MLASTLAVSERTLQAAFVLTTIMRRPRWCRQAQRLRPSAGSLAWRGSTDRGAASMRRGSHHDRVFGTVDRASGDAERGAEGCMIPLLGGLGLAPRAINPEMASPGARG